MLGSRRHLRLHLLHHRRYLLHHRRYLLHHRRHLLHHRILIDDRVLDHRLVVV
jgi:hypothetical protein